MKPFPSPLKNTMHFSSVFLFLTFYTLLEGIFMMLYIFLTRMLFKQYIRCIGYLIRYKAGQRNTESKCPALYDTWIFNTDKLSLNGIALLCWIVDSATNVALCNNPIDFMRLHINNRSQHWLRVTEQFSNLDQQPTLTCTSNHIFLKFQVIFSCSSI